MVHSPPKSKAIHHMTLIVVLTYSRSSRTALDYISNSDQRSSGLPPLNHTLLEIKSNDFLCKKKTHIDCNLKIQSIQLFILYTYSSLICRMNFRGYNMHLLNFFKRAYPIFQSSHSILFFFKFKNSKHSPRPLSPRKKYIKTKIR